MPSAPAVQYASRTDVGMRRSANQDSLAVRLCSDYDEWHRCGHLFVVADGMGGHAVGDLASRIAIDTLPHAYFKRDAPSVPDRMRQAMTLRATSNGTSCMFCVSHPSNACFHAPS